jgi:2-(1,2-epoxy-1,2-dihydrophenyl)acetyl-CoA isomerase
MTQKELTPMLVRLDLDDDGIATITLNRPEKLNALSGELATELAETVLRVAGDVRVRGVVITGAGRAFCAGGDIDGMRRHCEAQDWSSIRDLVQAGATVVETLFSMPKPTVAAINGPAAGAGGSLALACDFRIASQSASFGLVFSRIGLHPDWGGTYFLPRIVGTAKALELILSGDIIDAAECSRLGIVNRVTDADHLLSTAREYAVTFAAKAPLALTLARQAVYSSVNMTLKEVLALEVENQMRIFPTADAKEGISAFLEKRRPTFTGA